MAEYLEKDLQDFLMEYGGFSAEENYFEDEISFLEKEFSLENHGRIDILGESRNFIYIIELKRNIADANALVQVLKYKTAFETFLKPEKKVRCILVAPEIENNTHNAIIGMQDTVCYIKNKLAFSFKSNKFHLIMDEINKNKLIENAENLISLTESFSDEVHIEFYSTFKNEEMMKKCCEIFDKLVLKVVNLSKKISCEKYSKLFDIFYLNLNFDFKNIKEISKNEKEFEEKSFENIIKKLKECEEEIIKFVFGDE